MSVRKTIQALQRIAAEHTPGVEFIPLAGITIGIRIPKMHARDRSRLLQACTLEAYEFGYRLVEVENG